MFSFKYKYGSRHSCWAAFSLAYTEESLRVSTPLTRAAKSVLFHGDIKDTENNNSITRNDAVICLSHNARSHSRNHTFS